MANTLGKLNDKLFEQLARLTADGMERDEIDAEIERSKAVSGLANSIIQNGRLIIESQRQAVSGKVAQATETTVKRMLE